MDRVLLRSLSLCGLLAAVFPASGQDLPAKITFSTPAARLSAILPALGKQMGLSLTTTAKTGSEVLILRVKDVPAKDLMAKIATAANGEWKAVKGGFELTRPSTLQNEAEKTELGELEKGVQVALDSLNSQVAKLPPFTDAEANRLADAQQKRIAAMTQRDGGSFTSVANTSRIGDAVDESPAGRAIAALLNLVGSEGLATIGDGERVVYSTNANQVQRQLPGKSAGILTDFIRQQQILAAASQKSPSDDNRKFVIFNLNTAEIGPGKPELGIGKALLTLNRTGLMVRVRLLVADPNGQTITTGDMMFPAYRNSLVVPRPSSSPDDTSKIALSPLASEFAAACKQVNPSGPGFTTAVRAFQVGVNGKTMSFTSGNTGEKTVQVSPELRARILHPEQFDPQSLAPTEGFVAAADAKTENLVAALPDSAIVPLTRALSDGVSVATFLSRTAAIAGIRVSEADGWLIAMPNLPVEARNNRMDREALGKLLRSLDSQSVVRLNELISFAFNQSKTVGRNDYDGLALRLVNAPGASDALTALSQPNLLRFYGSLSQTQRQSVESGGILPFNTLTPTQVRYLAREVYQSQFGPSPKTSPQRMIVGIVGDLSQERTEFLPNGIPSAGTLQISVTRQPVAFGADASGAASLYTPDSLASNLFQADRPDMAFFGAASKLEKFVPAGQASLSLHFELPQFAQMDRSLSDTWIEKSANAVTFDGLPADMKARTEAALQAMKDAFGNVKINLAGAIPKRNIPPAP